MPPLPAATPSVAVHVGRPASPARRSRLRIALTALLVGCLAMVGLVLGPIAPAAAYTSSMTSTEFAIANAVLNLMNSERKAHGLAPYRGNSALLRSSRGHDIKMATANTLSHQLPGEPVFTTRITNAGYHWSWAGENIAWTADRSETGALNLEKMMYNEVAPNNGHRLNILSTHYVDVGVDILIDNIHGKLWITQDFARPA
jgi:uncharacterized protein YkwD